MGDVIIESSEEIEVPTGFGMPDVIDGGSTALVYLDKASDTAVKAPYHANDDSGGGTMEREIQVYERLYERGGHKGILRYHGPFEHGIRLEYAPNYDMRSYLQKHDPSHHQRLLWAREIAEALDFIHDCGIVHGDLSCLNILLDGNLHAKIGDFAGSSVDGSPLLDFVAPDHTMPGDTLNVKADVFAFGSVLYHIFTGHPPSEVLPAEQINSRYEKGEFADVSSIEGVGVLIDKCWRGIYRDSKELVRDLRAQEIANIKQPRPPPTMIQVTGVIVFSAIAVVIVSKLSSYFRRATG